LSLKFQVYADLGRLGPDGGFFPAEGADSLVVLLHAYNLTPQSLRAVAETVREARPLSDVFMPRLPVAMFSLSDPEQIAVDLIDAIDGLDAARLAAIGRGYRDVVLIGHSLGAMLVRKVWAVAQGATPDGEVDEAVAACHPWADKTSRIILLAALNRGWRISSALNPLMRLTWTLADTSWGGSR